MSWGHLRSGDFAGRAVVGGFYGEEGSTSRAARGSARPSRGRFLSPRLLGPESDLGSQLTLCFTGTFKTCRKERGLFTPYRVGGKPNFRDTALMKFSALVWKSSQEQRATFVSTSGSSPWSRERTWAPCSAADPERAGCKGPRRAPISLEVALMTRSLRALGSEAGSTQRAPQGVGCRVDPLMPTPMSGRPCRFSLHTQLSLIHI